METATTRDWAYALILLAMLSAVFLGLRFHGQAFVTLEFEILVIHVPTVTCLLVYVATRRFGLFSKPASSDLTDTAR
ncbi:hypothetical protein [[Eubacterium] cellulosolvens]